MPERPPLRHCPVCGIAMQASRTRPGAPHFDRFECLSCQTVISAAATPAATKPRQA